MRTKHPKGGFPYTLPQACAGWNPTAAKTIPPCVWYCMQRKAAAVAAGLRLAYQPGQGLSLWGNHSARIIDLLTTRKVLYQAQVGCPGVAEGRASDREQNAGPPHLVTSATLGTASLARGLAARPLDWSLHCPLAETRSHCISW